jgi:hypothetical protein
MSAHSPFFGNEILASMPYNAMAMRESAMWLVSSFLESLADTKFVILLCSTTAVAKGEKLVQFWNLGARKDPTVSKTLEKVDTAGVSHLSSVSRETN